jgi:glutamate 5-kinase
MNFKRVTIKVGTSTLTYNNGKLNLSRLEHLVRTIADLKNRGVEVILVTSGAIGVGVTKLNLLNKPTEVSKKQAAAAVGQLELMFIYNKLFSEYSVNIGQVLLTKDVIDDKSRKQNVINTLSELLTYNVVPIINENDTVSIDELVFGDNDNLSATVATLTNSELLIILTDIDGLYDKNPRTESDAKFIDQVEKITKEILSFAGGVGSTRGTGGMITKLQAAEIAMENGIDVIIANGENPSVLIKIIEGKKVGTKFIALEK